MRQRADRYNEIGAPKSEAGERTVPLTPIVLNALKEWKLAAPKGDLDLVFGSSRGTIQSHANLINRALVPAQMPCWRRRSRSRAPNAWWQRNA